MYVYIYIYIYQPVQYLAGEVQLHDDRALDRAIKLIANTPSHETSRDGGTLHGLIIMSHEMIEFHHEMIDIIMLVIGHRMEWMDFIQNDRMAIMSLCV